jgi:hypothetical protein
MPVRTIFIAASLIAFISAPTAQAAPKATKPPKECPHAHFESEEIVASIGKAATCKAALDIFEACAGGASGDTEFGEAVTGRCERDFVSKLTKAQKNAYDREHERCDRKYAKKEGSMYISFAAFCRAEVAQKHALRYGTAAPRR